MPSYLKHTRIVVVDNGASTIKLGVKGFNDSDSRVIPNAIVRSKGDKATYYGHEIEKCTDYSSLHYRLPFEKGYLVDWDAQKAIWDGIFTTDYLMLDPTESSLLMTEPYFNLPNLQDVYDQFVFEEYEFQSYYRCTPASLVSYGKLYREKGQPSPECVLVVDSGFSFTHVVPMINGSIMWEAVKRIDVGGKLLTNQLKELVSFRQWNMMDETYVMNDVKESCCFVSTQFTRDLDICRANPIGNPIVQEYILPDFSLNRRGHVRRPDEMMEDSYQILHMNSERFAVPEIMFRPDDIGLEQAGLAQTIAHSISLLPEDIQGMFWSNIGLIGGSTKFPNFCSRLAAELRTLAPVDSEVKIYESSDPILEAYRSAIAFASKPDFLQKVVTREEYNESGSNACRRKFPDWKPKEGEAALTKGKVSVELQDVVREDEEGAPAHPGDVVGRKTDSALG
ncbi:hypothetical protein PHLGIDRAFT_25604 [Phlebiopsis gigantea 11061_1 CR5-6]|uniref:Actin-like protein ARP6 n=1 Tax=Phlebiopsis gigantea (strain 11061_1 CR5-6) TaxID=745531 RepID=A0A0C3RU54_PHLG1|nr:hypothetical protein PHLGIDRAFT_25604 [Phlebiopsis gigantea 11061_1 CR5-6]